MSTITLRVNGGTHTVDVEPSTPLLYILRNDLDLHGPRFGCGLGQCGACTVITNGLAIRSCVTPVSAVKSEVTTPKESPKWEAPSDSAGVIEEQYRNAASPEQPDHDSQRRRSHAVQRINRSEKAWRAHCADA